MLRAPHWNEYGLVLGLEAPPRRPSAPAAFTARAVAEIWAAFSTAQGPAMTVKCPSPIWVSPTSTIVSWGCISHPRSLYGERIGLTLSTIGSLSRWRLSIARSSPRAPRTTRFYPGMYKGRRPRSAMRRINSSACSLVACGLRTMIMGRFQPGSETRSPPRQRWAGSSGEGSSGLRSPRACQPTAEFRATASESGEAESSGSWAEYLPESVGRQAESWWVRPGQDDRAPLHPNFTIPSHQDRRIAAAQSN